MFGYAEPPYYPYSKAVKVERDGKNGFADLCIVGMALLSRMC